MSGATSGLPGVVFSRNGQTWFIPANEPLWCAPAGSIVVILSLVPMVRLPPPEDPPSPLSSLLPPQADSASAAAVMPAVATSVRRPLLDTEYIRYLVLVRGGQRAREGRTSAAACGQWRCMTNTRFPRREKCGRGRDRVVTTPGSRCDRPLRSARRRRASRGCRT